MNNEEIARGILVHNKEEFENFKHLILKVRGDLSRHKKRMRPEIYLAETLIKDVEETVDKIINFYNMVEKLNLIAVFDDSMKLRLEYMKVLKNLKEETNVDELVKLTTFFTILDEIEKWRFEH